MRLACTIIPRPDGRWLTVIFIAFSVSRFRSARQSEQAQPHPCTSPVGELKSPACNPHIRPQVTSCPDPRNPPPRKPNNPVEPNDSANR